MKAMVLNELYGLEENLAPLELPELPDPIHLRLEKEIKSVANICRKDLSEFLALAGEMRIKPEIQEFALEDANEALVELKTRRIRGGKGFENRLRPLGVKTPMPA